MLDWRHSVRNSPLRQGVGETRFPQFPTAGGSGWHPSQAGGWRNRVSPVPNRWWKRLDPPQAGAMGKPGYPSSQPLLEAAGTPHRQGDGETGFPQFPTAGGSGWHPPQAGGWGNPVTPVPNRCWKRLAPPQAGGWGNPVTPVPNRCWKRLDPHRQGDGETRFPRMFTSVIHAAAPHNAGMNIVLFLGGRSPPGNNPPAGRVWEGFALPDSPAGGLCSPQS